MGHPAHLVNPVWKLYGTVLIPLRPRKRVGHGEMLRTRLQRVPYQGKMEREVRTDSTPSLNGCRTRGNVGDAGGTRPYQGKMEREVRTDSTPSPKARGTRRNVGDAAATRPYQCDV